MDLILDFGNTNQKIALVENQSAQNPDIIIRVLEAHPMVTLPLIQNFIRKHPGIDACILSSVVRHPPSVPRFLEKQFPFIELNEQTPVPVKNRYQTPETLGKDRLAAAVLGASMFPGENVLVINAGTCITYDFVNDLGEYIGGSISPGMQMRFRALHTFTGKLPLLSFTKISDPIGLNTEDAIQSGVVFGIIHEIEGVAGFYKEKYPGLKVIFSGGDLFYLVKKLKISIFAVPYCVIYGLHQILQFNVKSE